MNVDGVKMFKDVDWIMLWEMVWRFFLVLLGYNSKF